MFLKWLKNWITFTPFYIGGKTNPYMLRWFILPRNPWFNCYLHKFMRDDDDRALHDHPWWFVSIMLKGQYFEWVPWCKRFTIPIRRRAGSIVFRRAEHRHRVTLNGKQCWTLVFTGPKAREWGFWCPKGFVPWTDFVDATDEGNVGKGCG